MSPVTTEIGFLEEYQLSAHAQADAPNAMIMYVDLCVQSSLH